MKLLESWLFGSQAAVCVLADTEGQKEETMAVWNAAPVLVCPIRTGRAAELPPTSWPGEEDGGWQGRGKREAGENPTSRGAQSSTGTINQGKIRR